MILWLAVAGFVIAGVAQLPSLHTMSSHGASVIDFEFVRTTERAQQMLDEWGPDGRSAAHTQLYLDYAFLVSYSLLYALTCGALAVRAARAGRPRWAALGAALSWVGLGAGIFDALENVSLLAILGGHHDQPFPAMASLFAATKFLLSGAVLVYILLTALLVRPGRAGVRAQPG